MKWPDNPTCHSESRLLSLMWRAPMPTRAPYGWTFRTCSYCGSIHPEDLVRELEAGAKLGGADWKYGYPHKFYVEGIPNPLAGQIVECGSRSATRVDGTYGTEPIMGPAPATSIAKWYNDHIGDEGYDDEARARLLDALRVHAGISFAFEGGKLTYRAPHAGYQR